MAIIKKKLKKDTVDSIAINTKIANESNLKIPFSLPFSINSSSKDNKMITGFSLPFCNPFYLGSTETDSNTIIEAYPAKELAWRFYGILFDENIVAAMKANLTLIEEVKSRILVDMFLIDRNHLKIKWSGSPVEKIQVYKKLDIDDEYAEDGKPIPWEQGSTIINIGDGSYNIQLRAPNGSGESNIIELFDTSYTKTKTALNIAINEKTYYFEVDFKETSVIDVNF